MNAKRDYWIIVPILLVLMNMFLVATNRYDVIDTFIYDHILRTNWLTSILLVITRFGSTAVIVGLCVLFLIFYKNKKQLLDLYGAIILSTIINNVLKVIFRRPRPALMTILNLAYEKSYSFPSGHAMATMTFYGFLIYMLYKSKVQKSWKVMGITLLSLLILLVGFSRIYVGVHYFSDVFTGFLCSIIILFFYIKALKKLHKEV